MPYLDASYSVLAPSVILVVGALACLLLEVSRPGLRARAPHVGVATLVVSAIALYVLGRSGLDPAGNAILGEVGTDLLTLALAPAFYLAGLGAIVLGRPALARDGRDRAEYEALVLISTAGALLLCQARDLLVLFLALETLSIPLYVLAGFLTDRARSIESALKYFTVGAFSSAFVAFGIGLTYGATGTLSLSGAGAALAEATAGEGARPLLALAGLAFLVVGFGFKVALVPFHAWAPDVYQGAPTAVTAFLGVGSKTAGFAGLLRLLTEVFPSLPGWEGLMVVLAALTLIVGNCVALLQEDVKRLIAYSGVSHAGYVLMGVVAHQRTSPTAMIGWDGGPGDSALVAVVFYLLAYSLMTLGALAVVAIVERQAGRGTMLADYAGLAARHPGLAAVMLVFLLSLGGMPPLAGFVGKWLVFQATVDAGLVGLAVVGAATSVIGFAYYLRIVLQMYLRPSRTTDDGTTESRDLEETSRGAWALVAVALTGTVVFGLLPWLLLGGLAGGAEQAALR